MSLVISIKDLSKTYQKQTKQNFIRDIFAPKFIPSEAVKNISLDINKGESVAFLGPNGAGKTTTIKMLSGLIYPTNGSISVLGFTPFDRKREYLLRIGLVMGNKAGLNWDLTAVQSFELLREIYDIPSTEYRQRLNELSSMLDTEKFLDTQIRKLSLGERMKMELIGAILHRPEILFLDEPTIGLDIISKKKIRGFLREIQARDNTTILLTSHDMDDIEIVCDRVVIINSGEKVYDDSLAILNQKYKQFRFIKLVFSDLDRKRNITHPGILEVMEMTENTCLLKVAGAQMSEVIGFITQSFDVADIEIQTTPLEEIISDIFQSTKR
jgi:ABC-2 type transport system ATP-binding protein